MVSHLRFSDKSLQVFITLLSIPTDLHNAEISMVSLDLLCLCHQVYAHLVNVKRGPITICIIVTFILRGFFFISLAMSRYLSLFSNSFNFTFWSAEEQSPRFCNFSDLFVVDYYKIWSSDRDLMIHLYLEISEEFVRLFL